MLLFTLCPAHTVLLLYNIHETDLNINLESKIEGGSNNAICGDRFLPFLVFH